MSHCKHGFNETTTERFCPACLDDRDRDFFGMCRADLEWRPWRVLIALAASVTLSVLMVWLVTGFKGFCNVMENPPPYPDVIMCSMVIPW